MNTTDNISAPIPPTQPTDLAKMVEAAAEEISVLSERLNIDSTFTGIRPYEVSAILLRHLQPLVEQGDDLQRWKNEQLAVESCWDVQAVGKLLGLPLGIDIRANIESCIVGLQSQLTAAQEELSRVQADYEQDKQHFRMKFDEVASASRDALDTARKLDDRNGLIHQLRSMLREAGFNDRIKLGEDLDGNEDWQQIRVECQLKDALDKLAALHSSAQKGAEDGPYVLTADGERIDPACERVLYYGLGHTDGIPTSTLLKFDNEAREWYLDTCKADAGIPFFKTRKAVDEYIAQRSAKPEASP